MRIYVFEYITGGGMLDTNLPPSLVREGDLMLRALASDLGSIDGIQCLITRDARLAPLRLAADCWSVRTPEQFAETWAEALDLADAVWPIVPEHQAALERVTEAILAAGKGLLNSRPHAVRATASKLQTLRLLEDAGIPVVPTFGPNDVLPDIKGRWVLKPDDGAGCLGIRVFKDRDALCRAWDRLDGACPCVAQPFINGTAASLSLVAKDGEAVLLAVNRQRVALMDETLVLLGCVVNGLDLTDERLHGLADAVAAAYPGLWGYVGVDLMLTPDGPLVLEVNPRLTSSYAGLTEALGLNPAELVLGLHDGQRPRRPESSPGLPVEICLEFAGVA
ncbi:ATP-grasp domain-containing protein [Thiorhodococcus minor]|uniref:ATP-grasp domain-containing protein n=1 Tax=Thiorhodococcus minor TaxID=57489 RepID=A0A6M0K1K4_9GAMM|nr:ATP-grasp domain-containing protein [Thiorhodococcus minor]NEV63638.1 ATP-grasp domain-containing protein [Thiorhodococcus minor]